MAKIIIPSALATLLLFSMILFGNESHELKSGTSMELQKVIEVSNQEAIRLGYKPDQMTIVAGDENEIWLKRLGFIPSWDSLPEVKAKLHGRKYWAIHYMPKRQQRGGDLWIFIDKKDGVIISALRGQ